jgi:hypothetical protein
MNPQRITLDKLMINLKNEKDEKENEVVNVPAPFVWRSESYQDLLQIGLEKYSDQQTNQLQHEARIATQHDQPQQRTLIWFSENESSSFSSRVFIDETEEVVEMIQVKDSSEKGNTAQNQRTL